MKDVVSYLPWIGLAVGVFALFLRGGAKEKVEWSKAVASPLFLALLAVVGAYMTTGDVRAALIFLSAGAVFGCLVSVAASILGTTEQGTVLSVLGFVAFLVGNSLDVVEVHSIARLGGIVCGLAIAALPTLSGRGNRIGVTLISLLFVAGALALISRIGYGKEVRLAAPLLVWSALLSVGVVWAAARAFGDRAKLLGPAIAVVALAGLSWLVFDRYLGEKDVAIVCVVAVAATLLTAWAVPVERQSVATWGMAAVIWLGMATYAFSTAQGLGMAAAGFVGVAMAFVLGRRDLLPPIGILVGLAVYRLFRENNAEVVQAFDIGQHYAMIGFLLGIVVLVAVADALARRRESRNLAYEGAIVGLIAAAIVVGSSAFFGPKGAIGLVVGLAVAPMVAQLASSRPSWTFAAAAVLQSAALVAYRPLAFDTSLDRDGKLKLLLWLAAGVVVLYGALWYLGRTKKEVALENA